MKITSSNGQRIQQTETESQKTGSTSENSQRTKSTANQDHVELIANTSVLDPQQEKTSQPARQTIVANEAVSAFSGKAVAARLSGAQLNTGKLANLKEKLEVRTDVVMSKAEQILGNGAANSSGKFRGTIEDLSGKETDRNRSRELFGPAGGGMIGSRNGMLSDDPKETKKESSGGGILKTAWEYWRDVAMGSAKTKVGGAASTVAGTANTVLTANTDSPESKAREFAGWAWFVRARNGKERERQINEAGGSMKEPVPDANDNQSEPLTAQSISGIKARRASLVNPSPQADEAASGGAINAGAMPAGQLSMVAEFVNDLPNEARAINIENLKAIEARVNGKKIEEDL